MISTKEVNSSRKWRKERKKKKQNKVAEHKSPHFSLAISSQKTDANVEELNSLQKLSMASAKHKDNGSHVLLDDSSLKPNAITEGLKLAWKTSRKIKKQKQREAAEQKDKGSCHLLDNSSLKTDTTTKEVNYSLKTDTTTKEVNSSRKNKINKKQDKAVEHKDKGPNFSADNSSLKTDAIIDNLELGFNQSGANKKKKQCEAVGPKDKGSHFSVNNSSLNTDATSKEENSLRKQKKERKKKKQGKSIEHADKGFHVSLDNSSLKTDATKEVSSSRKRKRERKKKKQGKDIEHKDKGSHLLVDNSSLKTDASSKEVNSSQTQKGGRKKKKRGRSVEHKKDKGSHVSLDNSSLKIDATTEELNSSRKRKRKRKKKKHGKAIEHKPKGSHLLVDNSSLKIDANIEDPLHEPPAPTLLDSQETVGLSLKKKNKKGKRKKAKQHTIENIVNTNSCGPPNDTFSSKASTPALHRPAEHLIQFVSTDPVREQSGVETDICQPENEVKQYPMPKKVAENSNVECDVQELSYTRNTVLADADCCAKESVLEIVELNKEHGKIDSNSNHKDNSDFGKNSDPEKNHVNSTVQHMSVTFQSDKTYTSTERVNSNHGRNGCHPSPVLQHEEANGRQLDCIDTTRNDVLCAAGDVTCLSLASKTGGQSKIPHLPLGRTITCKHYSKNKLLILDVNGLLADFVTKVPKGSKPPDIYINKKKVYKRPFCVDFIQFCLDKFHVGVWSSRVKHNLDKAIKFLFGKSASKLLFCWNQSHCTITKSFTLEDKHKPLVFKDLRKLWDKTVPNLPWEKGEFNESNTLLLDDSPYKALLNPRYTAIFPHSYHFDNTDDRSLAHDGDLQVYLKGLAMAENVQEYVSANPFGQEPITETSPSWDFYSEIIEVVKHGQNDAVIQAASSSQRSSNQSSTAMDQGTASQPPSAVGAPPQQTEAQPQQTEAPPQQTEAPPQQTEAPPQQTEAPPQQTEAPPQQTEAPPQQTETPPQQTEAPPQQTEAPPQQTEAPPQQTEAPLPPAASHPPQQTGALPPLASRDPPQ